ncbi:MAG TPA: hydroxyacid dehydrogenase [Thermoplasmata archaeon]|nr:hydroxyacid dehydrogenase [Thermoplasmata archaeon]
MVEPPLVVVADPIDAEALGRLRDGPCRVVDASRDPTSLPSNLADAWGLVVRSRTKVTQDLIAQAPNLKLIARAGVGVDNVDLAAASSRGIRVVNAPVAATTSVAELTVTFCLLLARGVYAHVGATKAGRWERGTQGHEIAGKTVGLIGYGHIGREVARRLTPFGVSVIAYDPFVSQTGDATELTTLDEVLRRSDILSLHAALTPENHHLIDARAFERMKPGVLLVNVARGPLVDEIALLEALRRGRVGGAALDVFEVEPPKNRELLEHPNVIATPHIGALTPEAQGRAGEAIVDEVLRALQGQPLQALVASVGGAR